MTVMEVVKGLVSRANARKTEQAASNRERFRQILESIIAGEKIQDFDELEVVLEAVGKKPEDLAPAAELLQQRKQWDADAKLIPKHQSDMEKSQAKLDALVEERNRVTNEYQEKINALYQKVRESEQLLFTAINHRDKLAQTCDDPVIIEEQKRLQAKNRELHADRRPLEEAKQDVDKRVSYYRSMIEGVQSKLKGPSYLSSGERAAINKEIAELEAKLAPYLAEQERLAKQIAPYVAEMAENTRQIEELSKKALIP